jgi:phenylalanyl-tRNA synthetase alpha chain
MAEFLKGLFGEEAKIRLRPSYFPFVEPGFEIDASCSYCKGKGCRICKNTGWIELMGAGMVNQKVFTSVGFNEDEYEGFAFGLGLERIAMLKYKIDDIRLFYSGDLRFLEQF